MDSLSLSIKADREIFAPGEEIEGQADWQLASPPERIYLRLFWFTRGKGTEDVAVVSESVFDHPGVTGTRTFKIPVPMSPYSFSGRLVSLIWALELTVKGADPTVTKEIVISPYGHEIDLTSGLKETL